MFVTRKHYAMIVRSERLHTDVELVVLADSEADAQRKLRMKFIELEHLATWEGVGFGD